MKINIIVAIARHNAIGKGNNLLCHLPADLKYFKQSTTAHSVVMGRKTFESLPNGALPNRKNIVLSRTMPSAENYFVAKSIDEALKICQNEEKIFIIGGADIYAQFFPLADKLLITWIDADFEADTFFPAIDFSQWEELSNEKFCADEKNKYPYSFAEYQRKN